MKVKSKILNWRVRQATKKLDGIKKVESKVSDRLAKLQKQLDDAKAHEATLPPVVKRGPGRPPKNPDAPKVTKAKKKAVVKARKR